MNHRFHDWAFVGAIIAVLSGAEPETTRAQDVQPPPRQGPTMRVACSKDMQSLCPGLVGKDARQCLKEHRAQLSAECTAFFREAQARRSASPSGASPPGPSSPGEPETAGAQGGQSPPRQGPTIRVACSKDMQSLCPGLVGKDARQCLKEHRAQLSAECTAFFKEAQARRSATPSGASPPGGPTNGPDAGEK